MVQVIFIIAAISTILGFGGIIGIIKNWSRVRTILAEWTRRGIKVIYIWISQDNQGSTTLYFYLCGEEKSWLFPSLCDKNRNSHILAIKSIHYHPSYGSYSNRDNNIKAEWQSQEVRLLSEELFPALVKLVDKASFRFEFYSENNESIIVSDSYKIKAELTECKKKYKIKYTKKSVNSIDRWKIRNRYPT